MNKIFISLLLCISFASLAQDTPTQNCASSDYRAFDFWVGDWRVITTDADGNNILAGQSTIRKTEGGCVIHERWQGQSGYAGQSLNGYDNSRDVWQQTWMDNQGRVLNLTGGQDDTDMVLSGKGPASDGSDAIWSHKIRWHPDSKTGEVTQTWSARAADSDEWQVLFTGLYQPASAATSNE